MSNQTCSGNCKKYPFSYKGNVILLIIFILLIFPLGVTLLLLNTTVRSKNTYYSLSYRGSRGWLIFWSVVFFPVAIILGAINGFDMISREALA